MSRNKTEQVTRFRGEKSKNKLHPLMIQVTCIKMEAADNVHNHRTVKQTTKLRKISLKEADRNFILPYSKYESFLPADNWDRWRSTSRTKDIFFWKQSRTGNNERKTAIFIMLSPNQVLLLFWVSYPETTSTSQWSNRNTWKGSDAHEVLRTLSKHLVFIFCPFPGIIKLKCSQARTHSGDNTMTVW